MSSDDGFFSRWSRRKVEARHGAPPPQAMAQSGDAADIASTAVSPMTPLAPSISQQAAPTEPGRPAAPPQARHAPPTAEPLPTLADVAQLTRESDFSRFVAPGIDEGVKQAAMKKLFSDPHFNVMDGLDTYIDDYNKSDPIPLAMLRQMTQSKALRLFDLDDEESPGDADGAAEPDSPPLELSTAAPPEPGSPHDEDADLQLQQDHAAGRPGPEPGTGA